MKQFRFRAFVTLDSWNPADRRQNPRSLDPSATHPLMIHAWHAGLPSCGKSFPAAISRDDGQPLEPGRGQVVTIAVADDEVPQFLAPGRSFTIWGRGAGHGIISRRVFTSSGPS